MIKTVKQACRFNPVIQDYRMSQGIENLADLIHDAGDGREFFSRNFVTHGMEQLFREGLLRLSGKSDQAVFELARMPDGWCRRASRPRRDRQPQCRGTAWWPGRDP